MSSSLHQEAQNVSRLNNGKFGVVTSMPQDMNFILNLNELQNLYKKRVELNEFINFKERQLRMNFNSPLNNYFNYTQPNAQQQQMHPTYNHYPIHYPQNTKQVQEQPQTFQEPPNLGLCQDQSRESLLNPPPAQLDLPHEEDVVKITIQPDASETIEANTTCTENNASCASTSNTVFVPPQGSYAQVLMKNALPVEKTDTTDYWPLFQKICTTCFGHQRNPKCKNNKSHINEDNYWFACLPYQNRCLRSHCLDLACQRTHHSLTKRLTIKCSRSNCSCPHYVHPNDSYEGKPYYWKPFADSIEKPSKEEMDSYFLLKKKEKDLST
jgi:hypothetical protein